VKQLRYISDDTDK